MGMTAIVLALLAQPYFEKDPWAGCGDGSWVKYRLTRKKSADEWTIKLTGRGEDGALNFERTPGLEDFEQTTTFAGWLSGMRGGASAPRKSETTAVIGKRAVRAAVEEFPTPEDFEGTDKTRVTSTDAIAGGIVKIERDFRTNERREKWTYEFRGIEKLKAGDREIECLRFEHTSVEGRATKASFYWLSSEVPGLLVKSKIDERVLEVVDFKVEK